MNDIETAIEITTEEVEEETIEITEIIVKKIIMMS